MSKNKILVVEDEPDVATYLQTIFQDNGYEVIVAVDGVQAMEKARIEKPDLITLDIVMPNQTGIRSYHDYNKYPDLKNIPIIFITAMGEPVATFMHKMKTFGDPEGFMAKPIDKDELIKMVKSIIG